MLTTNDCLLLLSEIESKGINTKEVTTKLVTSWLTQDVIKYIDTYRPLEVKQFYENIRKNYNNKKSKLYKEIVQIDQKQPKDIVITLSCLLTQILLFSNKVEDRQLFLNHSRADEISKVLHNYFVSYDITLCVKILNLIKADLKALESLKSI